MLPQIGRQARNYVSPQSESRRHCLGKARCLDLSLQFPPWGVCWTLAEALGSLENVLAPSWWRPKAACSPGCCLSVELSPSPNDSVASRRFRVLRGERAAFCSRTTRPQTAALVSSPLDWTLSPPPAQVDLPLRAPHQRSPRTSGTPVHPCLSLRPSPFSSCCGAPPEPSWRRHLAEAATLGQTDLPPTPVTPPTWPQEVAALLSTWRRCPGPACRQKIPGRVVWALRRRPTGRPPKACGRRFDTEVWTAVTTNSHTAQ